MTGTYQARWISKTRADAMRREARGKGGLVLSAYRGIIVVEPKGTNIGDGKILSAPEADYELQPIWCIEPKSKLDNARKLLGLNGEKNGDLRAHRPG